MSYAVMPIKDYTNICEKLREKTDTSDKIKSGEIPNKIDDVYTTAEKNSYDNFWDIYQSNGTRTDYRYAFSFFGWYDEIFKPKYDINVNGLAGGMFQATKITDICAALKKSNVKLSTAKATDLQHFASYSSITTCPTVDTTAANSTSNLFYWASSLETIEKIILKADGSQTPTNWFYLCNKLKNLTFEGVIGKNGLDLHWSTELTGDSIKSVINALSDITENLSVTFSNTAVTTAFGGSESEEWINLISSKPNWNIVLV